jgi:ABC-type sugar transport system permease subunit
MTKLTKMGREKRRKLQGLFFVFPFIIGTLAFFTFPLYISVKLSFGKLKKMTGFIIEWLGLDNFSKAFMYDINFIPMFIQIIKETIIQIPLIIIFSIIIAILINKNIKFKGFFRVIFFLPFLLGTGDVMNQLLNLEVDRQIFSITESILLPREIIYYIGPKVAETIENFFSVIVLVLWNSGVQILLYLSGLQSISISLYESAKVDGATEWEMFWKITLPMISPVMLLTIVYTIVASFTEITNPILSYIQSHAFRRLDFAYAAALGWIYFLFIIVLVVIVFILFKNYIYTTVGTKGALKNERKDL